MMSGGKQAAEEGDFFGEENRRGGIMPQSIRGEKMPREAVLARFELRLNHNMNLRMHGVRVVKDQQRHIIHLKGNPFTITLIRDGDKHVVAHSEDLGLFAAVKDLPAFMIRLLS